LILTAFKLTKKRILGNIAHAVTLFEHMQKSVTEVQKCALCLS